MTNKQTTVSKAAKAKAAKAEPKAAKAKAAKAEPKAAKAEPKAAKAAKAAKAEPKAAKAAKAAAAEPKAAKAAKAAAGSTIAIHINKTGRVCFGKLASERIGKDFSHAAVQAEGKTIQIVPTSKAGDNTTEIRWAGNRPYISATKVLKATGAFDGSKAFDIEALPLNSHGFKFQIGA
jgi:hypothetical protein